MTLAVAHEIGFAAAMACGLLGLLLGHELPQLCYAFLAMVPISAWQARNKRPLPTGAGAAVGLAFFAWAGTLAVAGAEGGTLRAACVALLGILAARLLTRVYPSHDLQALVLSLLLMFAGTLVHQAFTYALVLVVYTITATWALLTRQLISGCTEAYFRDGNRAALAASLARTDVVTVRFGLTVAALSWCILLATGVLFVVFPRVGVGHMSLGDGARALPDSISLSGSPRAGGSDEVLVRLRGIPQQTADAGLYLRGRIYDVLRNDGFAQSGNFAGIKPSHMRQLTSGAPMRYTLELEQVDNGRLLALGPVTQVERLRGTDLLGAAAPGEVAVQAPTSELVALGRLQGPQRLLVVGYNVPLRAAASHKDGDALPEMEPAFAAHFLALPQHLDPQVVALAKQIVGDTQRFSDRALKLRQYLLRDFTYTLEQPNAQAADPLHSFLFTDRRGHCEYFAVAYAVLLRAAGVPSRVVGGYQGGTYDVADATVLFSGRNAHAWVEWYLPQRGWVVDDATPPNLVLPLSVWGQYLERARAVWEDSIMQFGLAEQLGLLKGMAQGLSHMGATLDVAHPLASGATWTQRRQATAIVAAAALLFALGFVGHRLGRRRRGPKLGRALLAALERLAGEALPPGRGYAEALEQLRSKGALPSAEAEALLDEALALYLSFRFGPLRAAPKTARLCRRLGHLRRKVGVSEGVLIAG